jgi:PTS system galactitol-specific IIA component
MKRGYVKDTFVDGILHRERTNPTGLMVEDLINIAIPHTDVDRVIRPTIVVVKEE